jgi:hypothetical protein
VRHLDAGRAFKARLLEDSRLLISAFVLLLPAAALTSEIAELGRPGRAA